MLLRPSGFRSRVSAERLSGRTLIHLALGLVKLPVYRQATFFDRCNVDPPAELPDVDPSLALLREKGNEHIEQTFAATLAPRGTFEKFHAASTFASG
jgi:hypothetical protein